jgi:ribosomal protein L28
VFCVVAGARMMTGFQARRSAERTRRSAGGNTRSARSISGSKDSPRVQWC